MTLFEYLAIAFSIVFSMTAARLAAGLSHASDRERRSLVHLVHTSTLLLASIGVFWLFWGYRDATWTFFRFTLALANPGLLYVLAVTLIPDAPATVSSWQQHFDRIRWRYFLLVGTWVLVTAALTTVVLELPLTHPARAVQLLLLGLAAIGASSSRPRVQLWLAVSLALLVVAAASLILVPRSFEA
jgi:hypothetical protein